MSRFLLLIPLAPAWLACAWGSLKIHTLDLNLGHSICGPWGCGPPVEALIGYHAFSAVMLLPLFVGAGLYCSATTRRKVGLAVILLGLVALTAIAGKATYDMWAHTGSTEYLVRKFFFTIATKVDVPIVQVLLGGCGLAWFGRTVSEIVEPAPAATMASAN